MTHTFPPSPTPPSIEVYGHSWMADVGATASRYGMVQRLANMLGGATVNRVAAANATVAGLVGTGALPKLLQSGLATDLTAGPYVPRGGLKLCMIGSNDYVTYQPLTNGDLLVENCLRGAYARLLASRFIPPIIAGPALNAAELTYSSTGGAWTAGNETNLSPTPGRASHATSGNYVELALDSTYQGEALTFYMEPTTAAHAIATVTVDGGSSIGSLDTAPFSTVLTGTGGISGSQATLRIAAGTISPGSHTVRITFTSIATFAHFAGIAIAPTVPPPLIVLGHPPLVGNSNEINQSSWGNARVANVIGLFPSAHLLDLSPAMAPSYPSADASLWSASATGHPNNLGHQRCAALIYPAVAGLLGNPDTAAALN